MKYYSPIKVNLFLHIINQRKDGYHNLETIFVLLDFYDEIEIDITNNNKITRTFGNKNIPQNDDLIIKAAKLLQYTTKTKLGANIAIYKKIPIGGGLGGGSSNAATILLALNNLWQTNLNNQQLQKLGLKLGADVPVFITQKSCFASGIGEKIKPIELPKYHYLILCPNQPISTQKIFSDKTLTKNSKQGKIPSFLEAINLSNDCLELVMRKSKAVKESINYLNTTKNRISPAKLSGTGSCVFAIFSSEKAAKIALKNYKYNNAKAFIARSI